MQHVKCGLNLWPWPMSKKPCLQPSGVPLLPPTGPTCHSCHRPLRVENLMVSNDVSPCHIHRGLSVWTSLLPTSLKFNIYTVIYTVHLYTNTNSMWIFLCCDISGCSRFPCSMLAHQGDVLPTTKGGCKMWCVGLFSRLTSLFSPDLLHKLLKYHINDGTNLGQIFWVYTCIYIYTTLLCWFQDLSIASVKFCGMLYITLAIRSRSSVQMCLRTAE